MNNLLSTLTAANAGSVSLALSDGTPVEFVKITSRDRIQVRIPSDHPFGAADDLRIFERDGRHYKDETSLTLVATAAEAPAAEAPAAGRVYLVAGNEFANLDDAKDEAIDLFIDTREQVEIVAITRTVVGTVGISLAA